MDDKLVKAYIGENATKILNNIINWQAGLLAIFIGPVWFFYRKSWQIGILYILIAYILSKSGLFTIESTSIILGVITIFLANKIYVWDAKRKVSSIINSNKELNGDELIKILNEKGGVSISCTITYAIILVFLLIAIIANYISQYSYVFDSLKDTIELIN